ncbi:hypothetical protein LINGRAHAP2_LOCUS36997 [Linum grandiflorum]
MNRLFDGSSDSSALLHLIPLLEKERILQYGLTELCESAADDEEDLCLRRTRKSGLFHLLCGNEQQVEKDDIFGRLLVSDTGPLQMVQEASGFGTEAGGACWSLHA